MTTLTASEARKRLYTLVDDVADSHEAVQIVGKRNTAILVAEEDWHAIQETLYLASIPGMRESIREGLNTPLTNATRSLTGELAAGFHQAREERCKKIGAIRFEASSRTNPQHSQRRPVSDTASLRETHWRPFRCMLAPDQYTTSFGLPGSGRHQDSKGHPNVDSLRVKRHWRTGGCTGSAISPAAQ